VYQVDLVYSCLGLKRKDCCQVLPSGEECPYLEPQQKDCFLVVEYQLLVLLEQEELLAQQEQHQLALPLQQSLLSQLLP
jgi:hypothetical protein